MRAYDCIWAITRIPFKSLFGNKHVIYCIAMASFLANLIGNRLLIPPDQISLF